MDALSAAHSGRRTPESFTAVERHGPTYGAAKLCLGLIAGLTAVLAATAPLDTTTSLPVKIVTLGVLSGLVVLGLGWAVLSRRARTFSVDERGIHLSRFPTAPLEISWDSVTEVEYGAMPWYPQTADAALHPEKVYGPDWRSYALSRTSRRMMFPYLSILRKRGRAIRFVERLTDDFPTGSVAKALAVIEVHAANHGIRVAEKRFAR